jgi:hypothetical protein
MAALDPHPVALMAARAGQTLGMPPLDEFGVTGVRVQKVSDREVHGSLRLERCGRTALSLPERRPGGKLPCHHLPYMSRLVYYVLVERIIDYFARGRAPDDESPAIGDGRSADGVAGKPTPRSKAPAVPDL